MDLAEILGIVSIAFLGSFGHCIGMCGGIVVAYSSIKLQNEDSKANQVVSHLLYSFGRVFTYTLLGVVFGYIGKTFTFSPQAKGGLLLFAGVLMVLAGLSLLGKLKFLTLIEHSFSSSNFYRKTFKKVLGSNSRLSFFFLGMLNGLLPCGFVYFFAITAASTASAFWGGVVMFVFGVSTIPAMFGLGMVTSSAISSNFRKLMMSLSSLAVIFYGIFTIYKSYNLITNPNMKHSCGMMKHKGKCQ